MEMTRVLQNLHLHPVTQHWNAPQQTPIVQTRLPRAVGPMWYIAGSSQNKLPCVTHPVKRGSLQECFMPVEWVPKYTQLESHASSKTHFTFLEASPKNHF